MNTTKKLSRTGLALRLLVGIFFLFTLYIIVILIWGTCRDYQPANSLSLPVLQPAGQPEIADSILTFTTWNLGYGGLGAESDFFYDNDHFFISAGQTIRSARPLVDKNVSGILQTVRSTKSDFFLLQEVDHASRRSYYINQVDQLSTQHADYAAVFAPNFIVPFVPIPLLEPWRAYGRTHSGLLSMSRFGPSENIRLQLPGSFSWPTRIFQLDRCVLVQRFPVAGGKELTVLNIHNSAYDADGLLKRQQMAFLRELLLEEYQHGRYVIAGGDWNECPPYFRFDGFMPGQSQGYTQSNIPDDFLPPGWTWVYDPTLPTNRKTRAPYQPGASFVTLIDFFLISPNVQVKQVKTLHQDFRFSDHQPVWMEVRLLP